MTINSDHCESVLIIYGEWCASSKIYIWQNKYKWCVRKIQSVLIKSENFTVCRWIIIPFCRQFDDNVCLLQPQHIYLQYMMRKWNFNVEIVYGAHVLSSDLLMKPTLWIQCSSCITRMNRTWKILCIKCINKYSKVSSIAYMAWHTFYYSFCIRCNTRTRSDVSLKWMRLKVDLLH